MTYLLDLLQYNAPLWIFGQFGQCITYTAFQSNSPQTIEAEIQTIESIDAPNLDQKGSYSPIAATIQVQQGLNLQHGDSFVFGGITWLYKESSKSQDGMQRVTVEYVKDLEKSDSQFRGNR